MHSPIYKFNIGINQGPILRGMNIVIPSMYLFEDFTCLDNNKIWVFDNINFDFGTIHVKLPCKKPS